MAVLRCCVGCVEKQEDFKCRTSCDEVKIAEFLNYIGRTEQQKEDKLSFSVTEGAKQRISSAMKRRRPAERWCC